MTPTSRLQQSCLLRHALHSPWIAFAFASILACLAFSVPQKASAQASSGVTGTVTDSSGAVVPQAKVTITNEGTSVADRTITSSVGTYAFRGLVPGKYTIEVDAQGFKKAVKESINVDVSTTPTIDFALITGAASETVQVTADQTAMNTTQPELGSEIEPVVVEAMPVEVAGRGRQIDSLQFLAPGTTGSTFSHRISGGVDFEQEILYNGIPAPQPETEGYTTNFNPPYDLVEESKVERSTFSAQFGLGQGALSYEMKSGTNQYHGELFEINRNSFFDSVGFFNGPSWGGSSTPPPDHENNYGFDIGGPIRIPHLYDGRNRTFGHYSQEWYKQNNENTNPSTVPTAAEKTGDFTDWAAATGENIYDPTTGAPFTYNGVQNVIPPGRISPASAALLQFIPNPDRPGSGAGGLIDNKSFAPFINPHIQHVWGFVIDQTLTPTQSLHYSEWRNSYSNYSFDYNPLVVAPNPLNSMKYEPALGSIFLLNYANTLTPHLVMTAGFGWIGEINDQYNITKGYTTSTVTGENIPPNITFGTNSDQNDDARFYTDWGTSGSWFQSINRKLGIAIVNNWLWTKGRNTFNIGGEFRRAYQDDNEEQTEGGHFNFSPAQTSTSPTNPNFTNEGNAFASYLLGLPDSSNRSNSQELELRNLDISPYVQDDIKLTPKLTVNLGVRWDMQVPFTENHDLIVFFDPDHPGTDPAAGGIPGQANRIGNCTGCIGWTHAATHFGHVGPRLGFAYELNSKTVIQAGFDIAFLNGGAYEYGTNKVAVNYGNLLTGSYSRPTTGSNTSSNGPWDTNPIPALSPTPFSPGLGGGVQINALSNKDGYAPYSQQWNLNVQRELPYNMRIQAAWVGNRVIHLPSQNNRIDQLNPSYLSMGSELNDTFTSTAPVDGVASPYPTFVNDFGGSATVAQALEPYPQYSYIFNNFEGFGTTYYQSAQIEVDKRFTSGLSFLFGYTLSRLMDNTSSGFSSFTSGGINKYDQRPEWAISNSDEPQTFKGSGTYDLPIGPGKQFINNKTYGNIVGGWQVGWILDYESGGALGPGENGTPFPNGFDRPDRNSSVGLSTAKYTRARDYFVGKIGTAQMWNPASFTVTPSQYVLGTALRNYAGMRGAPLAFENLNVRKHFYMGERFQGILQVDYFNAFNRTQFNNPDTNASDTTFGQMTSQGTPGNYPANRQGQVSFHLTF